MSSIFDIMISIFVIVNIKVGMILVQLFWKGNYCWIDIWVREYVDFLGCHMGWIFGLIFRYFQVSL